MLKGENIIVFSHADWKIGPISPQHISMIFAEENKVLFIETFGSRLPTLDPAHIMRVGRRLLKWHKGIERRDIKSGHLYIYYPVISMVNHRPFLYVSGLIYRMIVKHLIRKLDMANPILLFYIPPPIGVIEHIPHKAVIYNCVDEWMTFPGGKNRIFIDFEKRLIESADLVLTATDLLYERKKSSARRIHKLYHGVDYGHFSKEFDDGIPLPEDIRKIPRPIIAVIGAFADWMDMDLIRLIAESHREWSIVSIGTVESNVDVKRLAGMRNVYFLGQKDYSELPDYYRAIDVFIIPFLLTEHIKYCAPTRFYEHLSSGKPVVTIDFHAAHEVGEGLVGIASGKEDFVKKIEAALREDDPSLAERRKVEAKRNTWRSRVEEISRIIKELTGAGA